MYFNFNCPHCKANTGVNTKQFNASFLGGTRPTSLDETLNTIPIRPGNFVRWNCPLCKKNVKLILLQVEKME